MLNIAFYVNSPIFNGDTPYLEYLGGTESAIVYISEQLSLLGHTVSIFNKIDKDSSFKNVKYYNHNFFNQYSLENNIDILIFVRVFIKNPRAKIVAFWSEDDYNQTFPEKFTQETAQAYLTDLIITVSNYHTNKFIEYFGLPKNKFYTTRNGINPIFFEKDIKKEKYRLIYTSTAFRGLDILLDIYPEILSKFPETNLHIFSSLEYLGERQYNKIYKQILLNNSIKLHKPVSQPQLALEIKKSYVFSYTNTFPETSCISALEAQASGTPIVTTDLGALSETIENDYSGFCIKEEPYSNEYKKEFLNKIYELFSNDDLYNNISNNAKKRIYKNFTWEIIAKEWEKKFYSLLEEYNNEKNIYNKINNYNEIKGLYRFNSISFKRLEKLKQLLNSSNNQIEYNEILNEICKISFYYKINNSEEYFLKSINLLREKNIIIGKSTELSFIYFINKNIKTNIQLSLEYAIESIKYLPDNYSLNIKLAEIYFFTNNDILSMKYLSNCINLKKEYKNQDKHILFLAYLSLKRKDFDKYKILFDKLNLYSKNIINNMKI